MKRFVALGLLGAGLMLAMSMKNVQNFDQNQIAIADTAPATACGVTLNDAIELHALAGPEVLAATMATGVTSDMNIMVENANAGETVGRAIEIENFYSYNGNGQTLKIGTDKNVGPQNFDGHAALGEDRHRHLNSRT